MSMYLLYFFFFFFFQAEDGIRDLTVTGVQTCALPISYTDENGNERTDNEVVARSRLRVDARKWLAGKMAPKKYGDKLMAEHTGKDGGPIETKELSETELARRVAFLLTSAATKKD